MCYENIKRICLKVQLQVPWPAYKETPTVCLKALWALFFLKNMDKSITKGEIPAPVALDHAKRTPSYYASSKAETISMQICSKIRCKTAGT